jgi:hypothetical protein
MARNHLFLKDIIKCDDKDGLSTNLFSGSTNYNARYYTEALFRFEIARIQANFSFHFQRDMLF